MLGPRASDVSRVGKKAKKHLKQSFCHTFFYSQPSNEMFIFNSKSSCCSGTFTNVLFTSLLSTNKEYLMKI